MIPVATAADTWTVAVPGDWPGFAGHFPGDPILPGAELVELARGCAGDPAELRRARFLAAVRPGDTLRLRRIVAAAGTRISVERGDQLVAELIFAG